MDWSSTPEPQGPLFYLVSRHYRPGREPDVKKSASVFEIGVAAHVLMKVRQRDAVYGDAVDRWMVPA